MPYDDIDSTRISDHHAPPTKCFNNYIIMVLIITAPHSLRLLCKTNVRQKMVLQIVLIPMQKLLEMKIV
jgi:hypothetical protein